ncbi:hypothetical protein HNQ07_004099 [Deinococcus metalli]|uniref:Uncharacterized protein n=1 Tax=Deinococcus metalli TaxID=1141878 RepID=A0A7W8NTU7_9DEIO|nr:hypothetical protein [Deinococcus metalli]
MGGLMSGEDGGVEDPYNKESVTILREMSKRKL